MQFAEDGIWGSRSGGGEASEEITIAAQERKKLLHLTNGPGGGVVGG